ncbi:hypothetical protein LCI18_006144 [Fusarium solani-melongenae]|uniref:Uncharacterized protein n=1 Tax=Fusarium solani subsp. cucurbitae TaxID=2747967 RepID=A0ACD3Z1T2_FUSSC|nr:hypothetical protein LCI18_006144 [Fusarium solani-melongenae]
MADFARYSTGPSLEWLRFEKTWKRPEVIPTITIREARDQANNKTAKLFANILGRPDTGLEVTDFDIPTTNGVNIPIRLYRSLKEDLRSYHESSALYISFHGGGYHFGSLETEDPHCRQIALNTGFSVLNINYRHTPDWTFPAPVDDSWTAFQWAAQKGPEYGIDPEKIFVGGVSAGANLAISVALRALRDDSLPGVKGLILGTPSTVHPDHFPVELLKGGQSSLELHKDAPFINAPKLRNLIDLYRPDPTDPSFSPLLRPMTDFVGLCPVSFHIAGLDPLRDEGLLLEEKMQTAG